MIFNRLSRLKGWGRYACLGAAVLSAIGRKSKFHNVQKGRADYLLDVLVNAKRACQPELAIPQLDRSYLSGTLEQQAKICPNIAPQLVLMDSFAELTDQLFRHRAQGWTFCCNYQDVRHSAEFDNTFECLGLLDLDTLEATYKRLLAELERRWPGVPVIYLHFPDTLETREKFILRARQIQSVVQSCASRYSHLYPFSVADEVVKWPAHSEPGLERFPYHYAQETHRAFVEMILNNPALRRYF